MTKRESCGLEDQITPQSLELLRGIGAVYTAVAACDVSAAMKAGAILLGVSSVDEDVEGDGFRYLVGWPSSRAVPDAFREWFPGT